MSAFNRRAFLSAAAAAASAYAVPSLLMADEPQETVVLGLIGAGGRGHFLITSLLREKNVAVKYVCDVHDGRGGGTLQECEKLQGRRPQRVQDMRRIFDDPEVHAVVIATPEHWHALATIWACQAGKDVYVEKHSGLGVWDTRQMLAAARKYNRIVQVGTNAAGGTQHLRRAFVSPRQEQNNDYGHQLSTTSVFDRWRNRPGRARHGRARAQCGGRTYRQAQRPG